MVNQALRSRYVMADGLRTHYVEAGDHGPVVVLCHGGGAGSSGEAGFGRLMPLLAEHFQVYALDGVGGYGDTDPYWPAKEGTQSRVDQLEKFMDTLCLENVCLGGNSQGAWVAVKYALEHPDRVQKLFLVASLTIAGAMGVPTPVTDALKALNSYDGTRESMRYVMEALVHDKAVITDELLDSRQNSAARPGAAQAREVFDKGQRWLATDPNMKLKFEMQNTLPRLTIPTVFAWGAEDTFAPPAVGRELEKLLPNIPFRWVQGAAHQVQTDQPETLAQLMIEHFCS